MTEQEFYKGWTMLLVQPWAKMYTYGEDAQAKEQVQIGLYKHKFMTVPGWRWMTACQRWVEIEDHWPTMAEMHFAMKVHAPPQGAQGGPITSPALPEPEPAPIEYLPRQAYHYAKQHNIAISEACKKLMPIWLRENPDHPECGRVEALLASLKEPPIPLVKEMPSEPTEKYEFVTDITAEGMKGFCRRCETQSTVFVCWCEQWEGCRVCYAEKHRETCATAKLRTIDQAR